nr:sugar-transfer associated ATP-grasp domain-containing protein [Mariprofundus sp. KV]
MWYKLRNSRALYNRQPFTMVSWRFLLPGQGRAVQLQRHLFLNAWPHLPRWQWALIGLYNWLSWLLFFAWKMSYHRLKGREAAYRTYPCELPLWRQVVDLLSLIIPHGIPPRYYYMYGLWRKSRSQLMHYIYSNTAENWHAVFAAGVSSETIDLLWDKHAFTKKMAAAGIATVPTVTLLPRGKRVDPEFLFQERALFLKPNAARNSVGCMALHFDRNTGEYQLHTDRNVSLIEPELILAEVGLRLLDYDYLLQPMLQNHPRISSLCTTGRLVTLRLVSGLLKGQPEAMFALLEVPYSDVPRASYCMNIQLASGKLFSRHPDQSGDYRQLIDRLEGKVLPFWQEAVDLCLEAHSLVPDLPVSGWDVAVTPDGPCLLEGNLQWDVEKHQLIMDAPALDGDLFSTYGKVVRTGC